MKLAPLIFVIPIFAACNRQSGAPASDAAADARLEDAARAPDSGGGCGKLGAACGPGVPCGPDLVCCNAVATCDGQSSGYCFPSTATWELTGTCPAGHCSAPQPICLMGCAGCDFSTCVTNEVAACLCARASLYGCP